jgi:hypothetical protein
LRTSGSRVLAAEIAAFLPQRLVEVLLSLVLQPRVLVERRSLGATADRGVLPRSGFAHDRPAGHRAVFLGATSR